MSQWFYEEEASELKYGYAYSKELINLRSDYQKIQVLETKAYGRMLVIDGFVMLTEFDEFVYHEMISHIPACFQGDPKKVLVIGGGDGGTVRELLKHSCIEEITLCEIDQAVVDVSKRFFPNVAGKLDDPRVNVKIGDGISYTSTFTNQFDLIIVDSTDPIGPGEGLFTSDFYRSVAKALKPDGFMVAQSESPWAKEEEILRIQKNIGSGFSKVMPYVGSVPTYPRGLWSWTMATNASFSFDQFSEKRFLEVASELRYLTRGLVFSAFHLPAFFRDALQKEKTPFFSIKDEVWQSCGQPMLTSVLPSRNEHNSTKHHLLS